MGAFDGYDAMLKVHTKRSPHRIDGDAWRVRLLDGVLGSPDERRSDPRASCAGTPRWGSLSRAGT